MPDGVKAVPPNLAVTRVPLADNSSAHSYTGEDSAPTKRCLVIGNKLDIGYIAMIMFKDHNSVSQ